MSENIMIIHGMWGRGFLFSNFKDYFDKKGFNCITPDLPCHTNNKSEQKKVAEFGFDDFVYSIKKEIEKLNDKPIVIGHSMGGLIAHKLAEMGLAKKAVLITPATQSGIVNMNPVSMLSFLPLAFKPFFWRKELRPSRKGFDFTCSQVPEIVRDEYYKHLVPESGKAFSQVGLWALDKNRTTKIDNKKIDCPLFQIAADNDRMIPINVLKKQADILRKDIKDFYFKIYKESGHGIIWEDRWIELADDIYDWIKTD